MIELETILYSLGTLVAFAGVGLALVVWVAQTRVRGPEDSFFVGCLRVVNLVYAKILHGIHVVPAGDALDPEGPAIVVANHRGGADPLLVACCTRRWIHFLMAREYQQHFGLHWLFRRLGTIPVNRDGHDLAAMRSAMKELREGRVIGIFPQGGIRPDEDELGEAKGGVALLALHTGAPVIPAWLEGAPAHDSVFIGVLTPSNTTLWVGDPIRCEPVSGRPTRQDLEQFTDRVLESLHSLRIRAESSQPKPRESDHAADHAAHAAG